MAAARGSVPVVAPAVTTIIGGGRVTVATTGNTTSPECLIRGGPLFGAARFEPFLYLQVETEKGYHLHKEDIWTE